MTGEYTGAVATARDYYNSSDADNFYFKVWGGEDIHIGVYESPGESIFAASRRTVEKIASRLARLGPESRVLDIGSGYGGSARYLASTYGCRVFAVNLSEVENERHRRMNKEEGLDRLIEVVDASFEEVPAEAGSFDVVWSQDAILHSGYREKVVQEVARALKPGGDFVFTDPMQSDDCPEGVLQPVLDRIHLDSLGSPGFYRAAAKTAGMEEVGFEDRSEQLPIHYARVLEETEAREEELSAEISEDYLERMKKGLGHWVDGGRAGYLAWGIFHFRA